MLCYVHVPVNVYACAYVEDVRFMFMCLYVYDYYVSVYAYVYVCVVCVRVC